MEQACSNVNTSDKGLRYENKVLIQFANVDNGWKKNL